MAQCTACNASITWVFTEAGKRMPIDSRPVPDGNVIYDGSGSDRVRVLKKDEETEGQRFKSHFATCSSSKRFRKTRR